MQANTLVFICGLFLSGVSGQVDDILNAIPGIPGQDYPIFPVTVETSFICDDKIPGYYADLEGECQQYHICASDGKSGQIKYSFLCPNGTLFNQQYFICDWWFNVDCAAAEDFYFLNAEIAEAMANANNLRNGRSNGALGVPSAFDRPAAPPVLGGAADNSNAGQAAVPSRQEGNAGLRPSGRRGNRRGNRFQQQSF